jgi:hypothetical protein
MKKNRIHYENKRSRVMNQIIRALGALGEPSSYAQIDAWCWENVKGWVRLSPTPAEFGSLMAWSRDVAAAGEVKVHSLTCGYSLNTLWELVE